VQIIWSEPALDDLARIRAYIAETNPAAAASVARALLGGAASLKSMPSRGRPGEAGTRELLILKTYWLVHEVSDDEVRILRVWHGAQARRK
jgi:plasmid stabilization system protein ParE